MEFSSIWYFSFWSLISITFSTVGIYALRNATIDLVSYVFEFYFVLSVSCSISYAFLYRPSLEHNHQELKDAPSNKIFLNFFQGPITIYAPLIYLASVSHATISRNKWDILGVIRMLSLSVSLPVLLVNSIIWGFKYSQTIGNFFTGFAGPLRMYPYHTLCWVLFQVFLLLSFLVCKTPIFWNTQINLILTSMSIPRIIFLCAASLKKSIATSSTVAYVYQERRFFEIVCGMLVNTLVQYYFRVQSLPLMLTFLSFAVAWLGNIANVQPTTDFGIFQFLVTMGLQSAVGLFGLHFYTFLVLLVGIALMVLRWKMESVSLKHFGRQDSVVRDWERLEELYGLNGTG